MDNDFTKAELRHIMTIMNSVGPCCELCSSIRKKLESRIAGMPDEFFEMGDE